MSKRKTIFVSLAVVLVVIAVSGVVAFFMVKDYIPVSDEAYQAQLKQAEKLQSQSAFKNAIAELRSLAKQLRPRDGRQDSRLANVNFQLGLCLEKDGQTAEAIRAYERSIELANDDGGWVYVNNPALAEAAPRATILRCDSAAQQESLAKDFKYGVRSILKYGQNIPTALKEKFLTTYENYLLKGNKQADAQRVSSIAKAIYRNHNDDMPAMKTEADTFIGLLAAADVFSNPPDKVSEENDADVCNGLLNDALELCKSNGQKASVELKRAQRLVFDKNDEQVEKQFEAIRKLSSNLMDLTPSQKFEYWKLQTKFSLNPDSLQECIKIVNLSQLPADATLEDVNTSLAGSRLLDASDISKTLMALCEATQKLDGAQSFSFGTSCLNCGRYMALSTSEPNYTSMQYEKKGLEILSKLPHPNYGQLASVGVNLGEELLGMKKDREAEDVLEISLAMSKKADEQTLANGEELNPTNSSPRKIENLLATAYSNLKEFEKLAALSGDTDGSTKADGVVDEKLDTLGLLRRAYALEEQAVPDYHLAEKYYDAASARILRVGKFSEQYDIAGGPQSKPPFNYWTSQHIPSGLIGFYERFGRYDKIARFTEEENREGNWQTKDLGQLVLANCYLMGGDFDKARPILLMALAVAPPYATSEGLVCGTGAPVLKDQFARLLVESYLDGNRDGYAAERLYHDESNGLALPVRAEDLFNRALALDLLKKYDQSKIYHEKVLSAQQIYSRPGMDRQPDLDAYRKLAFKPDRSIEETAQLMEAFAWLHELPETGLNTAVDRADLYRKKHLGPKAPEILVAMQRNIDRCAEIKKRVKYADCRAVFARNLRLLDAQEKMNVDKAEIEKTKAAIKRSA